MAELGDAESVEEEDRDEDESCRTEEGCGYDILPLVSPAPFLNGAGNGRTQYNTYLQKPNRHILFPRTNSTNMLSHIPILNRIIDTWRTPSRVRIVARDREGAFEC